MSSKGRAVPPPPVFQFPNGQEGIVYPLSQFTIAKVEIAVRRNYPPPDVPLAPGVGGELQPNEADPDYQDALVKYSNTIKDRMMDALIDVGVDIEIDEERLNATRARAARVGAEIDEISERVTYIKHVAFAGEKNLSDELTRLALMITGQAVPSEADVQAHVDTFQGDVEPA